MRHPRISWFLVFLIVTSTVAASWYVYTLFYEEGIPKNGVSVSIPILDESSAVTEDALAYRFAIATDFEELAFTDPETLKEITYSEDGSKDASIRVNMERWFRSFVERGVSVLDFDLFSLDGDVLYNSPALFSAGFRYPDNLDEPMPIIMGLARKYAVNLMTPIEGFAHILNKLKPYSGKIVVSKIDTTLVASVIAEIADYARRYGQQIAINEEAYSEEYLDAIHAAAKKNDVVHIHFFEDLDCRADVYLSEDYAYYPYDARNNQQDKEYMNFLQKQGSYMGKLGDLTIMFGAANGCVARSAVATAGGWGLGTRTHQNIAVMRSVQFSPEFIEFIAASGDEGYISKEEVQYVSTYNFKTQLVPLLDQYARKGTDVIKKKANLVISLPSDMSEDYMDWFESARIASQGPISNAILSAGYEIVVTKNNPIEKADLYYVIIPGAYAEEMHDISEELAKLSQGKASVFYHVFGGMAAGENLQKVVARFGVTAESITLSGDNDTDYEPIPQRVSYTFPNGTADINYAGYSFDGEVGRIGTDFEGHTVTYVDPLQLPEDVSVLLVGTTAKDEDHLFDDETALVLKKENIYLINGSHVHLDMSQILANIMSDIPVYNAPSYGYFTNGVSRSVFFAPYPVLVDLHVLGGETFVVFDENGNVIESPDILLENGRVQGHLPKF